MITRFLTNFFPLLSYEAQVAIEAETNTDIASLHVLPALCKTLSACVTAEMGERKQNPAGSEWVLLSDDRWLMGNLENPNCVLSKTATAGAIILSLLNLSLSVCMCFCICVHTCVSMPVCVSVRFFPSLKAFGASGSCEKSILFGSPASLFI